MTVSIELARELLDMGARLRRPEDGDADPPQAQEQLRGAVAIHNTLQREGVAYLADEVGMGKTYVALGAIALFRHFTPDFRVAVIAPRENIQSKWMKEWITFSTYIVRIPDLRMRSVHGGPARHLARCDNLQQFIRETTVNPNRDFFLRLSSFSLGTGESEDDVRALRSRYQRELPWLSDAVTSLRKREFKDSLAKALCCALPEFDLLVVDEGHNLKHGFAERIAARNRVLAFMFGRPSEEVDRRQFRDYGPRAKRVLFLSATPIDDDYRQLWNQLDVFGKGDRFRCLCDPDASEDEKRATAKRFLIRRVTTLTVGEEKLTKNLYRREWRHGGVQRHDDPIHIADVRERLVVALVQKKVSELLNTSKFGASFQMGMLASFESFLETVKTRRSEVDGNFDGAEQTEVDVEREGIDVESVNELAVDYRRRFNGQELPHPKMDALVSHLSDVWSKGRKALVFLRRVASVWEVKERLDLRYNEWLISRLRRAFRDSGQLVEQIDSLYSTYIDVRATTRKQRLAARMGTGPSTIDEQDRGGDDTFFAWFFRGEGPKGGWVSGARFAQRFAEAGYELSTFFEENYVADLLGAQPKSVIASVAEATRLPAETLAESLTERSAWYLTQAKEPGRREVFEAVQGGGVELLREHAYDPVLKRRAEVIWQRRFELKRQLKPGRARATAVALEFETFFTALRLPQWTPLRSAIWPERRDQTFEDSFAERELRRELLSTTARLGHSLIDLYVLAMLQRGTLKTRAADAPSADGEAVGGSYLEAVLTELERQRTTPLERREWAAFDELSEAADQFDLILDVNEPAVRTKPLIEAGRQFGALLRQQQPVGGMTGGVNRTLVRQFRMPGYPFVLLSTDLLQEGEDLHTFCSDVYHYGLAWTPSAVEQRIGRVDRVRSKTERTAAACDALILPDEMKLQVFYPHLEDTVERLQVRRVLRRMHEFIRLMHEGLTANRQESSKLNVRQEIIGAADLPTTIESPLISAFPVQPSHLSGRRRELAVMPDIAARLTRRLQALRDSISSVPVAWDDVTEPHRLGGIVRLPSGRQQHFVLHLDTFGQRLIVRCESVVGRLDSDELLEQTRRISRRVPEQLGVVEEADDRGIDLTVEEEVLLGDPRHDADRCSWLLTRVTAAADRFEQLLWHGRDAGVDASRARYAREGWAGSHVESA